MRLIQGSIERDDWRVTLRYNDNSRSIFRQPQEITVETVIIRQLRVEGGRQPMSLLGSDDTPIFQAGEHARLALNETR